ncbi:response regulator transcription factor [Rhizobium sp. BK251]|uniref:LuxR C-terminal-related transcriptional regulator n=1 Tax=Rhizobium sp. BK251 TaxID=2512125 RepID=UPI00104756C1|nr:response regulator transcription factor [Rhizobium sp. BK251]TCL69513.1 LuxR family two component transcriptional regulator [Rhizobium sp. BK251]
MAQETGSLPIFCNDPAENPQDRPRIFVLSDIRLLREGIVLALSLQASVQVVGSSDFSIAPRKIVGVAPSVLILDITVSKGLEYTCAIRAAMPDVKIVALGVAEIEQVVIACAEAGVSGFVSPSGSVNDVVTAVHSAIRGELVCSPRTAGILLSHVAKPSAAVENGNLTPREREIVSLMSEGMSNKHIARQLGIQNATVKSHVHNILSKMRVRRRGEAAAQLLHSGMNGSEALLPGDAPIPLPVPYSSPRSARN